MPPEGQPPSRRPPARAEDITTLAEAVAYYRAYLARAHTITSHGERVRVVFEAAATHLYSAEAPEGTPPEQCIAPREYAPGRFEGPRVFNPERARLMGRILPAISNYSLSVPEAGGRPGFQKTLLYGPALEDGRYLRVVLRPGPRDAFTVVSAYPVGVDEWRAASRLKRAKFPP